MPYSVPWDMYSSVRSVQVSEKEKGGAPNPCVWDGVKYSWGLGIHLEMQKAIIGSKKAVVFKMIVSGERVPREITRSGCMERGWCYRITKVVFPHDEKQSPGLSGDFFLCMLTHLFLLFFLNFEEKVHLKEEGRRVVLELLEDGYCHPGRFMV